MQAAPDPVLTWRRGRVHRDVVVLVGEPKEVLPEVHDGESETPALGIGAQAARSSTLHSFGSPSTPSATPSSSSSTSAASPTYAYACLMPLVLPHLQRAGVQVAY